MLCSCFWKVQGVSVENVVSWVLVFVVLEDPEPECCDFICHMVMGEPYFHVLADTFYDAIELLVSPCERLLKRPHASVLFRYRMSDTSWHRLSTIALFQPGLLAGIGILEFQIVGQPEIFSLRTTTSTTSMESADIKPESPWTGKRC